MKWPLFSLLPEYHWEERQREGMGDPGSRELGKCLVPATCDVASSL